MACGIMHPAGAAAPTTSPWSRLLFPVPLPPRSSPTKELSHQVPLINRLWQKLPLSAPRSHGCRDLACCTSSASSTELAAPSRPEDVSSARSEQSVRRLMDSVPGAIIVLSGYWTGPDVDDGCGRVEAVLQRIV